MGLTYDPGNKKWNISYEKTDYDTGRPVYGTMEVWGKVERRTGYQKGQPFQFSVTTDFSVGVNLNKNPDKGWVKLGDLPVNYKKKDLEKIAVPGSWLGIPDKLANDASRASSNLQTTNEVNKASNELNAKLNQDNQARNDSYNRANTIISYTRGGDYVAQREALKQTGVSGIEDNFKAFYLTEKLSPWNTSLGSKPLYGDFDPQYYKQQNPALAQRYAEAVANDDVDIVNRYGENGFYLWHYTTQGKQAGQRGNAPETKEAVQRYVERKPTDKDLEDVRALQLGVDMNTSDARLLSIPYISDQFEKALNGDAYWKQMAKDNFLSIDTKKPEEFAALFRLSQRPEDKEVSFNYQLNTGYGLTELEDTINQAVGEKATVDVKRFGALTQNVLKDTIEEMKKAKTKEQMFEFLGGFGGFSEIADINKTLANSILGDSGVGGILAFTSKGNPEESLEKSLQNITGIRNNATYNWQQWFDNTLKKKYEGDLELGYTVGEAKANIQIGADFAREFIEKYLQPRFDTARSMDEFAEYLDVRQEEQNPFQTQDLVNAVTQTANLRSQAYLDQLKKSSDRYFDPEFYFNPTGDKAREDAYLKQSQQVSEDWETAKKGDPYWAQQAYRFGVNLNNKADFAKLHFQVRGQGLGYDGAEDILNAGKVSDEIYNKILPALQKEALEQGSIFGQFITPEEFADEMLEGLDPGDEKGWNETLERYGLTDFKGSLDELKDYIAETLRTGSAQEIREQIKYLNEKRQKPTQEKLGLTYIERPEDYKNTQATSETQLYKVFQNAGYQGSEDEFYETMFPDVDRTEQQLLTKAGTGKGLEMIGLDTSDPFAALGSIEGFFQEDQEPSKDTEKKSSSFFSLDYEDDEDTDYKSDTGQKILSDFTSFFKGFS
jgi:hypothetical protein